MTDYMATHEHFIQTYGDEYLHKIAHLKRRIIEFETGKDKFVVLPLEAGLGKSLQTDWTVGEYIRDGGQRRYLIVKKFIEGVKASEQQINDIVNGEREPSSPLLRRVPAALGITKENWRDYSTSVGDLRTFPVLIITHERYMNLCADPAQRKHFTEGRHTLIIDEALPIKFVTFSEKKLNVVQELLPYSLQRPLLNVCDGLMNEITSQANSKRGNELLVCEPYTDFEQLQGFASHVEANLDNLKDYSKREVLREFVANLYALYENRCVYSGDTLTTYDPTFRWWGLQNNLILDANGMIDRLYKLDKRFSVDRQTPIIDHSNWSLRQIRFSTSKSWIKRTKNYAEEVTRLVAEYRSAWSEKVLVVTQKEFEPKLQAAFDACGFRNVETAHFGNIIGKNDWRDFNQVWIVASPNMPYATYPLKWAFATGQSLQGKSLKLTSGKGEKKGRMEFRDPELESVRFNDVVKEMYQAIKRINRDNTRAAEVFVLTEDQRIIQKLQSLMKGIKVGEPIDPEFECRNPVPKGGPTRAERLESYLTDQKPGKYAKQDICRALNISKANLPTVMKHERIARLKSAGIIHVGPRHIERLAN